MYQTIRRLYSKSKKQQNQFNGIGIFTILETQLERETAALALTLRLEWPTYAFSFWTKGRGVMEPTIEPSALSASSHTKRLSWDAFSSSCNSCLKFNQTTQSNPLINWISIIQNHEPRKGRDLYQILYLYIHLIRFSNQARKVNIFFSWYELLVYISLIDLRIRWNKYE